VGVLGTGLSAFLITRLVALDGAALDGQPEFGYADGLASRLLR